VKDPRLPLAREARIAKSVQREMRARFSSCVSFACLTLRSGKLMPPHCCDFSTRDAFSYVLHVLFSAFTSIFSLRLS